MTTVVSEDVAVSQGSHADSAGVAGGLVGGLATGVVLVLLLLALLHYRRVGDHIV